MRRGASDYLGYSDAGFLLAAFDSAGLSVAHGPMVQDVLRDGGEAAIHRALDWLVRRDRRRRSSRGWSRASARWRST